MQQARGLSFFEYNSKYVIGGEVTSKNSSTDVTAFYSGLPYHGAPIALNYMLKALVKSLTGGSKSIESRIYPLPKDSDADTSDTMKKADAIGGEVAGKIVMSLAVLVSMFVYHLVKERVVGAKHMQVSAC